MAQFRSPTSPSGHPNWMIMFLQIIQVITVILNLSACPPDRNWTFGEIFCHTIDIEGHQLSPNHPESPEPRSTSKSKGASRLTVIQNQQGRHAARIRSWSKYSETTSVIIHLSSRQQNPKKPTSPNHNHQLSRPTQL